MRAVLFRCPIQGTIVQGWAAEDAKDDKYPTVECAACGRAHYVNPKTGKRLGEAHLIQ